MTKIRIDDKDERDNAKDGVQGGGEGQVEDIRVGRCITIAKKGLK